LTDTPLRKIVADIVREKLMESLLDEIPHSITTEVESFEETKTKDGKDLVKIECVIIAEKESHKAIIIGKKGTFLKKIGQSARLEIEEIVGKKVFLNLWVKINKNWTKDENALKILGYE
jgi:GTPase